MQSIDLFETDSTNDESGGSVDGLANPGHESKSKSKREPVVKLKFKNDLTQDQRNQLILGVVKWARKLAFNYWRYLKSKEIVIDLNDLISEAFVELSLASIEFDPSRGNKFNTYVGHRIQNCLKAFVARSKHAFHERNFDKGIETEIDESSVSDDIFGSELANHEPNESRVLRDYEKIDPVKIDCELCAKVPQLDTTKFGAKTKVVLWLALVCELPFDQISIQTGFEIKQLTLIVSNVIRSFEKDQKSKAKMKEKAQRIGPGLFDDF